MTNLSDPLKKQFSSFLTLANPSMLHATDTERLNEWFVACFIAGHDVNEDLVGEAWDEQSARNLWGDAPTRAKLKETIENAAETAGAVLRIYEDQR